MRAAELIAARARRRPADHAGAVARRRGDALRRRHPQGARPARLGAADAARRGHPARGARGSASGAPRIPRRTAHRLRGASRTRSSTASSSRPARCLSASSRLLRPDRERQVGRRASARSSGSTRRSSRPTRRRCTPGMPVLTAAPDYPARLVGVVPLDRRGLGRRVPAPRTRGDRRDRRRRADAGRRRRHRPLPARRALVARASRRRPRPASASGGPRSTTSSGPRHAHALLAERDPGRRRPRARERPPARRSARSSSPTRARRSHRRRTGSGQTTCAIRRRSSGSSSTPASSTAASRRASPARSTQGVVDEAQRGVGAAALRRRRARCSASRRSPRFRSTRPSRRSSRRRRRLARYQRKWLRRLPVAATLDAARPPEELADEICALAGAGERLPRR